MIYDFFWKKIVPAGVLSALVYLVFDRWHNWFLGALVLLLYFLFVSVKTKGALVNYFGFIKSLRVRLLAIFLGLATLGWFLGIFIFFNYFNGLAVFLSFFANALVWGLFNNQSFSPLLGERQREGYAPPLIGEGELEPPHEKISVLIYIGLLIYGFYLLVQSKTGDAILSPWQTIDSRYLWVFLAATFLLGFFILFSKVTLKTLLFFVILHSFLLHSYLPLTHDLFYGADGWRHMATESRLLEGKGVLIPTVVGEQTLIAKSNVGVLSYANFWGTNVVLAKILQIDLLSLTKWFLPIAWSLIFTILLYEIGLTLSWSNRKSLFLAWGGMWPFALQAGGSFSLPVNYGFLIFILFFLLLLKRAREPNDGQKSILLALGAGSALGYLLFFVLYWLSWGIMAAIKSGKKLIIIPGLILGSIVLPVLELAAKFSVLDSKVNVLMQAKQFVGNLFAIYLAAGPRPHEISSGNILFNQIPVAVFTPNFLTQFRWWLPALVLGAFVFIVLGMLKNRKDLVYRFILSSFVILLTSYFISFYLLSGEHLFSRRLDATLAFLFLILLFYGIVPLLPRGGEGGVAGVDSRATNPTPGPSPFRGGIKGGVLVLFIFSLAITASYSLGPDTFTVSSNQLVAAKYIWSQEKDNSTHCVIGDTYPLLALEAVSSKEIIGGGFPIDANFGQLERVELHKQMNIAINDNLLRATAALTKADHCWFIGETVNFARQGIMGGNRTKVFGDVAVVRYNTPLDLRFKN
jgi:hypothetical protein